MNVVFGASLCNLTTALGLFVKSNWPGGCRFTARYQQTSLCAAFCFKESRSSALNHDIFLIPFWLFFLCSNPSTPSDFIRRFYGFYLTVLLCHWLFYVLQKPSTPLLYRYGLREDFFVALVRLVFWERSFYFLCDEFCFSHRIRSIPPPLSPLHPPSTPPFGNKATTSSGLSLSAAPRVDLSLWEAWE